MFDYADHLLCSKRKPHSLFLAAGVCPVCRIIANVSPYCMRLAKCASVLNTVIVNIICSAWLCEAENMCFNIYIQRARCRSLHATLQCCRAALRFVLTWKTINKIFLYGNERNKSEWVDVYAFFMRRETAGIGIQRAYSLCIILRFCHCKMWWSERMNEALDWCIYVNFWWLIEDLLRFIFGKVWCETLNGHNTF